MKWVNGMRIIKEVLDSYREYNQLPEHANEFIERILQDLHYNNRRISKDTLNHYQEVFPHLFEENK